MSHDTITWRFRRGFPLSEVFSPKILPSRYRVFLFENEQLNMKEISNRVGIRYNKFHKTMQTFEYDLNAVLAHFEIV